MTIIFAIRDNIRDASSPSCPLYSYPLTGREEEKAEFAGDDEAATRKSYPVIPFPV